MIKSYHPDEFDGARGKDRSASCLTSSSHFLTPPPPPLFFLLCCFLLIFCPVDANEPAQEELDVRLEAAAVRGPPQG